MTKLATTESSVDSIELREVSLDDKYSLDATRAYITGIEALVRLPILQHQRDLERGLKTAGFVSGYRGSPLGGVDQAMWQAKPFLDKHDIRFVPGINEDLAATAVRGSQEVGLFPGSKYHGVFGMWYGKGPGLDRSIDAFRHANAAGTSKHGGVLAVVGDDHGCKSSTFPYQSEHLFMSLSMPVLAPANVQEVLDLGIFGWELSRYSGCWVGLKAITENMDSAISAEIDPSRVQIQIPEDFEMPKDGVSVRWPDAPLDQEKRLNKYKIYAALAFARANNLNKVVIDTPKPKLGIITSGKSYLDVLQAFDDLGISAQQASDIGIRVLKVGMPWPLEPVSTHEFARGLSEILVVEEKRSVIEDQLTGQLYNWPVSQRPRVVGEYDEDGKDLLTNLGELTPAMIARVIAQRLRPFFTSKKIDERITFIERKERVLSKPRLVSERQATFCSGCPHNRSTVVPEGSIAAGGIGCHYLAIMSDRRPTQTVTHMGGEGIPWVGIAPFSETEHIFQNLGDGTYFHSGILAIRQAVAAEVNITYKILYNDAVAMTGGQSIDGSLTVNELISQLRSEGVKRIELVSDYPKHHRQLDLRGVGLSHRDQLKEVQLRLRETKGCTVLIYEQTCATEKRRRKKRGSYVETRPRVFINDAVCEGCGDCSRKSNCLSVVPKQTELGRKRQIDQAACNFDHSCVNGFCPSFVSVEGDLRKPEPVVSQLENGLELPTARTLEQPWNVVIAGIGGTGVLTVTSVLSMAAHIEGKGVSTMNQTGLAQKFGPVVSHLRIAQKQKQIHAVRIPAGDADLILGIDLMVAASDDSLAKMQKDRSYAVVNESLTANAEFLSKPDVTFHIEPMKSSIERELSDGRASFLAATDLSKGLMGDPIACNFFMVGFAFQQGLVPLSAKAIHKALELNGVQVEFNQKAFEWGRLAASDPTQTAKLANLNKLNHQPLTSIKEILAHRYQDLVKYQDRDYANQYKSVVDRVIIYEAKLGDDRRLSVSVAKTLYRLMAIKDEYEVARLYTDGRFIQKLKDAFVDPKKLRIYLAPPLLARPDKLTGEPNKMQFGAWILTSFKLIKRMKFLRGTRLDLFGYTAERRIERKLRDDFIDQLDLLLPQLKSGNKELAIEIIELVNSVRGFGHVKLASYESYVIELERLLNEYHESDTMPPLSKIKVEVAQLA